MCTVYLFTFSYNKTMNKKLLKGKSNLAANKFNYTATSIT